MENSNPWLSIPFKKYEMHMSDKNVFQTQMLNKIMESQINDYSPETLAIFGVTTGNGLEHAKKISKVIALDINEVYLNVCRSRFFQNRNIAYLKIDIEKDDFIFGAVDMAICNLIYEYVDEKKITEKISGILNKNGILSVVFQVNTADNFISKSDHSDTFLPLKNIQHDIEEKKITELIESFGLKFNFKIDYILPNDKKLVRLDFKK